METLAPGARPQALRPIEGGAKPHPEDTYGRRGARADGSATRAAAPPPADAAVVRLSDEARALAAKVGVGREADSGNEPAASREPPVGTRLIDARA